jgi:hypothetical protein
LETNLAKNSKQKRPSSDEGGRFHLSITIDYSFRFNKKTLLPPAVVEKIKVFGSVLFE